MEQEHAKQQQAVNPYKTGNEVAQSLRQQHTGGSFPLNPKEDDDCIVDSEYYVFYQGKWTKGYDLPVTHKNHLPF